MFRKDQGFTLIELMIVVAIIAIIAAIAVPNLLSSRLAANESNAISTLRNLVSAQAQFQTTGAMDEDLDGMGEYGSFGELSGLTVLTRNNVGTGVVLNPPILASTFANIDADGLVSKSGYFFTLYLPGAGAAPLQEIANGGPDAGIDPNMCEILWCAYAWPAQAGTTGNRTFFVNQRGELFQTKMDTLAYQGTPTGGGTIPAGLAAYDNGGAGDMNDAIGVTTAAAAGNAVDGNTWTVVQ